MQKLKSKYTSPHFQKALNGEAYKSLEDTEMVKVKKRARQLTHKYNIQLPPVEYQEGMSSLKNLPEIYGSEEHYKTLSELFDKPIEECKTLYIETIQVDHGVFINFEGCKLHKEISAWTNKIRLLRQLWPCYIRLQCSTHWKWLFIWPFSSHLLCWTFDRC